MEQTRTISVFGSHAPKPGSGDYELAREIGGLLASAGFAVATGGYGGTMSAVSQGAAEADGHVIGVTCAQIEQTRSAVLNRWVKQEIKYESLSERMQHLVRINHGMIVLPGGIGTLAEFALAWNYLQVGEMSPRPLILFGEMWAKWFESFVCQEYVLDQHITMVNFADSPAAAVVAVIAAHQEKPVT
jgi:uncharacterized protein (TIGR00730 family)